MACVHAFHRVDVRYVANNPHLDFTEDTKLGATQAEDLAWRERVSSGAAASSSNGSNGAGTGETQTRTHTRTYMYTRTHTHAHRARMR